MSMHKIQDMIWLLPTWKQLVQWQHQKRLPHALLMIGSQSAESFAQELAQQLLCQQESEYPCGECQGCRWFVQQHHPDYTGLGIGSEDMIGVDEIRALQPFVHLKPETHQKVVVLNADRLNVSSSNALLKMLEEPQADVRFLLTTEHPRQLLATIRSRCVPLTLPKAAHEEGVSFVQAKLSCSDEQARTLLLIAQGCPVRALDFKESISIFDDVVDDLLGLAKRTADPVQVASQWCQILMQDKLYLTYALLNQLSTKGVQGHSKNEQVSRIMALDLVSQETIWRLTQSWYELMRKVKQPGIKAEYQVSCFLMDWQQAVR